MQLLFVALRRRIGVVKWRIQFRCWYELSRRQKPRLLLLKEIIWKYFDHPWVADVEFQIRQRPGHEEPPKKSLHWDAPIAITVARSPRRRKRQGICMSLYVVGNVIYIIQLQGFFTTDIPVPLRNWPRRFVEACQELAIKNRFKQVRIGKANWLYRNLSIREYETTTERESALEGVRTRMRSHYDGTARELDFAEKGNWFVWVNPYY
jgi:hypothetical protein